MANINTNAKNYKSEGRIVWINFRIQMPFMFWFLGLFLSNIRSKLLSMPLSWMSHISSQLDGKLELVLNIQPNSMLDNFIPIGCFSPGYLLIVVWDFRLWKYRVWYEDLLHYRNKSWTHHPQSCLHMFHFVYLSAEGNWIPITGMTHVRNLFSWFSSSPLPPIPHGT
jgi:hypothetical protein